MDPSSVPAEQDADDINAPYGLRKVEELWQACQPRLAKKGYMLRPRYHPGWIGSWVDTGRDPKTCEDSIIPDNLYLLDATRMSDGQPVVLKIHFPQENSPEADILQFLNSAPLRSDPRNHTVPLLDRFAIAKPNGPYVTITPLLREVDDPDMLTVGELLSYVRQVLEGLEFMHSHNVAHRDIALTNIMMDAARLYPDGFQSTRSLQRDRRISEAGRRFYTRTQRPPKYYFIDFGLSVRYPSFAERGLVHDTRGQFRDRIPEYSRAPEEGYDPFKADIFACGWMLCDYAFLTRDGPNALVGLLNLMCEEDPNDRPTAQECVELFAALTRDMEPWHLRAKLGWFIHRSLKQQLVDYYKYLVNLVRSIVMGQGKTI